VEVLIAFAILLVMSTAATAAVLSYIKTHEAQSALTQAMAIAEGKVEDLLVLYPSDAQLNGSHGPEYYDESGAPSDSLADYQVLWSAQAHDIEGIVALKVSVSWREGPVRRTFRLETLREGL